MCTHSRKGAESGCIEKCVHTQFSPTGSFCLKCMEHKIFLLMFHLVTVVRLHFTIHLRVCAGGRGEVGIRTQSVEPSLHPWDDMIVSTTV